MMKEAVICLLCSTFAFEQVFWKSNTESVPILRMRMVGVEDGTYLFLHRDCFHAFHDVLTLLSQLDLIFPWGTLVLAQFYSTDDISMIVYLILPEELKYLQQHMLL